MEKEQLVLEKYRESLIGLSINFREFYYQEKFDTKQIIHAIDYRIEDGKPVYELFVEDLYKGQILFRIIYQSLMERYYQIKTWKTRIEK